MRTQGQRLELGCHEPGNTMDRQQPPGASRGEERFFLEPSGGMRPCQHLDVGLAASRAGREQVSAVLSPLDCAAFPGPPWKPVPRSISDTPRKGQMTHEDKTSWRGISLGHLGSFPVSPFFSVVRTWANHFVCYAISCKICKTRGLNRIISKVLPPVSAALTLLKYKTVSLSPTHIYLSPFRTEAVSLKPTFPLLVPPKTW